MATRTISLRLLGQLTVVALLASLMTVGLATPALAATINVDINEDDDDDDGDCSLREAIESANDDNSANDDCEDGSGADVIRLDDENYEVDDGAFEVTEELEIEGQGINETEIDGNGNANTFVCDGTTTDATDRIFEVTDDSLELVDLTLENAVLEVTTGVANGGAILVTGTTDLTLDNVEVTENVACTSDDGFAAQGGGIAFLGEELTITESTLSNNSALVDGTSTGTDTRGGGLFQDGDLINVIDSTFNDNLAGPSTDDSQGGGVWTNADGEDIGNGFENSTISGNEAEDVGGGLYFDTTDNNDLRLHHVTVTDNEGGGVASDGTGTGSLFLKNTIVADQDSGADCFSVDPDDIESEDNNLDSDDSCDLDEGNDIEDSDDADLETLDDNDGPTETHLPEDSSDAIDAIDENDCDLDEDQRGVDRPQGDDDECDIGAVEVDQDAGGGGGGAVTGELNVTPESATNLLPADRTHTLSASFDESDLDTGDDDEVNFKVISGPNAEGGGDADFECTLLADRCTGVYTSDGNPGTDVICAWNDLDGDNDYSATGSTSDGGSCDSETVSGTNDNDFTDLVENDWVETDEPECDDDEDNDDDGDIDFPADDGCTSLDDDTENSDGLDTECNDGVDNDGDGDIDFPNDPGCVSLADNTEGSDVQEPDTIRVPSFISLRVNRDRGVFRGRVSSNRAGCRRNRIVVLKHVDPGPNTTVGRDATNRRGRYRVRVFNPRGRFYAVALRKVFAAANGDTIICVRDRSRRVRL